MMQVALAAQHGEEEGRTTFSVGHNSNTASHTPVLAWRRSLTNSLDEKYTFYHQNDVILACVNRLDFKVESGHHAAADFMHSKNEYPHESRIVGLKLEANLSLEKLLFFFVQIDAFS